MDKKNIVIAIVTKDRSSVLKETIQSLLKQDGLNEIFEFHLYIVDNSSEEEYQKNLKLLKSLKDVKGIKNIKIIRPTKNIGAGPGFHLIYENIKNLKVDFVLKSDDDVIYKSNYIKKLIPYFRKYKDLAAASGVIYYFHKPGEVWYSGGRFIKSIIYTKNLNPLNVSNNIIFVDDLVSCAMLIDFQALKKVGGFDRDFFVYKDDTSLCYRLRKQGFKLILVKDTAAYHKIPYPKRITHFSIFYDTFNRFIFSRKFHSKSEKIVFSLYMLLIFMPYKLILFLHQRYGFAVFKSFLKALLKGYKYLFFSKKNPKGFSNMENFKIIVVK